MEHYRKLADDILKAELNTETDKLLDELIKPNLETILSVLPSFHRVQKSFGPVERQVRSKFLKDVIYDLISFVGYGEGADQASSQTFDILSKAEHILHETYLHKSTLLKDDEERVERIKRVIPRAVWRRWKPWLDRENAAQYLNRKVANEIKFTRYENDNDLVFDGDAIYDADLFMKINPQVSIRGVNYVRHKVGERGYSPSAEVQIISDELSKEFFQLASEYKFLNDYMQGYSLEDLEQLHEMKSAQLKAGLYSELLQLCQVGVKLFDWDYNDVQNIVNFAKIRDSKADRGWEMSPEETWTMFEGLDLTHLMGMIEMIPPLKRKVILRHLGYLGNKDQTVKEWCREENISSVTYAAKLKDVLIWVDQNKAQAKEAENSIVDIINSSEVPFIKNSSGRVFGEKSKIYTIIDLIQRDKFVQGSLTEKERKVLEYIRDFVLQDKPLPTINDIASNINLSSNIVGHCFDSLGSYIEEKPRYATKDYLIEEKSSLFKVINWFNTHKDTPELLNQLHLSSMQLEVFRSITELKGSFYLTQNEIAEAVKKKFPEYRSTNLSEVCNKINKTLSNPPFDMNYFRIKIIRALEHSNSIMASGRERALTEELLRRIDNGEYLGYGAIVELSEKVGLGSSSVIRVIKKLLS